MALWDVLQARAANQGRTAEVDCGELGVLTVEALPLQEAEALARGADAPRAVFYAACSSLQAAGDAMHRAGELYTPDGIMRLVSDSEAAAAAQVVLALSGVHVADARDEREETEAASAEERAAEESAAEESAAEEVAADRIAAEADEIKPAASGRQRETDEDDGVLSVDRARAAEQAEAFTEIRAERSVEAEPFAAEQEAVGAERSAPRGVLGAASGKVSPAGAAEEKPRRTAAREISAAGPVRILRETVDVVDPAVKRAALPADWKPGAASAADPGESFARQLLEGLRRAKWARGV